LFRSVGQHSRKYAEIAELQWTGQTFFEEAKELAGLDHYEVRTYSAWHRHVTLSCAAMALLTALSANTHSKALFERSSAGRSSLEAFKKGRNLAV
jgi:SRSO17 transposase